jgi:tetratricopeptide (TPR) repeat protein
MAAVTEVERLLESGLAAEAAGNVREALIRYEAAVKSAPEAAPPALRLGTLCHRLRDYERARQLLERAAGLDPNDPEIAFRLGAACDALGDRTAATASYGRTMALAPAGWQTWFLIGRQHRQLGRAEVAQAAYRRALATLPEQPDVLAELGSLLLEIGRPLEALPYLEAAVKATRTDAGLALQLGLAYLQHDDVIAAQAVLLDAKHLDPADRLVDKALQDLASHKKRARRNRKAA